MRPSFPDVHTENEKIIEAAARTQNLEHIFAFANSVCFVFCCATADKAESVWHPFAGNMC